MTVPRDPTRPQQPRMAEGRHVLPLGAPTPAGAAAGPSKGLQAGVGSSGGLAAPTRSGLSGSRLGPCGGRGAWGGSGPHFPKQVADFALLFYALLLGGGPVGSVAGVEPRGPTLSWARGGFHSATEGDATPGKGVPVTGRGQGAVGGGPPHFSEQGGHFICLEVPAGSEEGTAPHFLGVWWGDLFSYVRVAPGPVPPQTRAPHPGPLRGAAGGASAGGGEGDTSRPPPAPSPGPRPARPPGSAPWGPVPPPRPRPPLRGPSLRCCGRTMARGAAVALLLLLLGLLSARAPAQGERAARPLGPRGAGGDPRAGGARCGAARTERARWGRGAHGLPAARGGGRALHSNFPPGARRQGPFPQSPALKVAGARGTAVTCHSFPRGQ